MNVNYDGFLWECAGPKTRVRSPEPFCDPERQASEVDFGVVFPLLPRLQNAFAARQAMSVSATGLQHRENS